MSSKDNNTESKISFLNTNDNILNNNLLNEEEKKKNYYKNILSNYKNFREFLPEGKEELYNNLKKYKKEFFYIQNNFTNTILIIDGENLLKSSKGFTEMISALPSGQFVSLLMIMVVAAELSAFS